MPSAKLNVAIYNDGGVYKYWTLFFEGPTDEEMFIFNSMGSSTRYSYEMRTSNARYSSSLEELITMCEVDAGKINAIKEAAEGAVIHNEAPGYNCQD